MIGRIISFIGIPIIIWMLIGSYREVKKDFGTNET